MRAFCRVCDYCTGDKSNLEEVKAQVIHDGGDWGEGSTECPVCKISNTFNIV
jgi:hypothetical protein